MRLIQGQYNEVASFFMLNNPTVSAKVSKSLEFGSWFRNHGQEFGIHKKGTLQIFFLHLPQLKRVQFFVYYKLAAKEIP